MRVGRPRNFIIGPLRNTRDTAPSQLHLPSTSTEIHSPNSGCYTWCPDSHLLLHNSIELSPFTFREPTTLTTHHIMASYMTASEAFAREKLSPNADKSTSQASWADKYRGVSSHSLQLSRSRGSSPKIL